MQYTSVEALARYVEAEWGDYFPPNSMPSHGLFDFASRNADFYRTVRECVQDATRKPRRILDIGAGMGRMGLELATAFPEADLVISEPSSEFVKLAKAILKGKKRPGYLPVHLNHEIGIDFLPFPAALEGVSQSLADRTGKLRIIEALAESVPYPREHFDVVLALNVIDRVPDPKRFIQTTSHFVRSGGVLILATPYDWDDRYTPEKDKRITRIADALPRNFRVVRNTHAPYVFRTSCLREIGYRSEIAVTRNEP